MSVIIGSARISEKGTAHGGQAGDQKQTTTPDYKGEVSMQTFYVASKGWIVARLKDAKQAEICAEAMETACNNPNIGYDQYQRYGLAPGKEDVDTKVKVETDCSALVRRCIYNATGIDVGDIRTVTMQSALPKSGLFEPLKQYTSGMTLYTGDILFTGYLGAPISGHTVVVVNGAARKGGKQEKQIRIAQPTLKRGDKGLEVKYLQKNLNKTKCRDENGNKLVEDGDFGSKTGFVLRQWQKKHGLEDDEIFGPKSWSKMNKVLNK